MDGASITYVQFSYNMRQQHLMLLMLFQHDLTKGILQRAHSEARKRVTSSVRVTMVIKSKLEMLVLDSTHVTN